MKLFYFLFIILISVITSCNDKYNLENTHNNVNPDGTINISFYSSLSGMPTITSRSVDPDGYGLKLLWIFCFDESRHYLGHTKASITIISQNEESLNGSFNANIPSPTRYIHIIANANLDNYDESKNIGRLDTEIIPELTSTSGILCYWGYHKFNSEDELKAFNIERSSAIPLFRNQARIRCTRTGNGRELSIKGFAIINQYSRGTIAPLKRDGDDIFNIRDVNEILQPTLCSEADKIIASLPEDISLSNEESTGYYVFEHENTNDNPLSIIFRINNQGGIQSDGILEDTDKYFKVSLVDENGNNLPILRNYDYVINFSGLPEVGGYPSFEEAVKGIYSNNIWVSIEQKIPSISDGESTLSVIGETTRIITPKSLESDGTYIIEYTWHSQNDIIQKTPDVTWIQNSGIAERTIINEFLPGTNLNHGKGIIRIRPTYLGEPQYGTIQIKAGKFIRTIKLLSISNFSFNPVMTTSGIMMGEGKNIVLSFNIPENFPHELFPLDIKVSTNYFCDSGNNLNINGKKDYLNIITEKCEFEVIEGNSKKIYKRDWPHKYIYQVNKPGLHELKFKTILEDYETSGDALPKTEFFIEADAFATSREVVQMVSPIWSNDYHISLGIEKNGIVNWNSEELEKHIILPVANQVLNLRFKVLDKDGDNIKLYANERFRLYCNPSELSLIDNSGQLYNDTNRGMYYITRWRN